MITSCILVYRPHHTLQATSHPLFPQKRAQKATGCFTNHDYDYNKYDLIECKVHGTKFIHRYFFLV